MNDLKTFIIIGIIVVVLIILALGLERLKSERAAGGRAEFSGSLYDLVSTFKGDAATSRAFTWYTGDPGADGWLEVIKGKTSDFTGDGVIKVQAANTTVKTDQGTAGVHKAEITGLEPGTRYTYRVGSGEEEGVEPRIRVQHCGSGQRSGDLYQRYGFPGSNRCGFRNLGQHFGTGIQDLPGSRVYCA